MEEKSFRILLDLTEINYGVTDLKYVWMYISPRELKTIFDFKRAISKKFPFVQENVKLFVRDGLLLENEKIYILREDDTVKLQYNDYTVADYSMQISSAENSGRNEPLEESISSKGTTKRGSGVMIEQEDETSTSSKSYRKKRKREKSHKTSQPEETEVDQEINLDNESELLNKTTKKRKEKHISSTIDQAENVLDNNTSEVINNSLTKKNQSETFSYSNEILMNSVPNCKENQSKTFSYGKNISMNSSSSCEKTYKVVEINDDTLSTNSKGENNTVNLSNSDCVNNTFGVGSAENETQQENVCKKKKRKRRRKRKEPTRLDESLLDEDAETSQNFYAIPKVDEFSNVRKHVIYSLSKPLMTIEEEIQKSSELSNLERISDSCVEPKIQNLQSSDVKSQSSSSSDKIDSRPKVSTPFSKRQQKLESWCITPLLNKINEKTPSNLSNGNCNNLNNESAAKIPYDDCPPLNCLPTVGTRLAYKTLELTENYCPEVTEYKEGIVRNVDTKTEELEIELIQEEIKPGRTGKFEIFREDEIPPPQIIKNVSIHWTALIEPKLVSGIC